MNPDHARIERLERELEEMTIALSQAWDQLVPFLQEVPSQAETTQDLVPILHAVAAAADAEFAGMYLFSSEEWLSIPASVPMSKTLKQHFATIPPDHSPDPFAIAHADIHWVFTPVLSERKTIGVLGIGTRNPRRDFNAVEQRIVARMAERIGSQIASVQLARIRERELALQREMQIANEIQQSIQPIRPPQMGGLQMAAYWQPAKQVGGDAWGWVQLSDTRLSWFVVDVSGKGLPAALAAVSLHTAISLALRMRLPPAEVLRLINEEFYDAYTRTDLIATAAILSLNLENGALEIANAGHPPLLVRHRGTWLRLAATAPPVGVLPSLRAEPQVLMLQHNDLTLCYSDGFTEIQIDGRLWGQTGLLSTIPAGARDIERLTQHIVQAAQHAGKIQDDQTIVAVMYTPK